MRLIRLDTEPSEVGADIRAAVSAWGEGDGVLGGVALFGCTPPGSPRPLDAVIVLPRGVIAVVGADLPQPALKLEAALHTPWQVDGWPLVRAEESVNPAQDAVAAASALARGLQSRGVDPLPVATMVVVGPYVEQVTQPTNDLHRGLRVVPPTTTAMLAAARELATYERACPAESAQRLLAALDERAARSEASELVTEGFPEAVTRDLASASTLLIPTVREDSAVARWARTARDAGARLSPRGRILALTAVALAVFGLATFALISGRPATTDQAESASQVDGVPFTQQSATRTDDCVHESVGDIRTWFEGHRCTMLDRLTFTASVSNREATIEVIVVELPESSNAGELQRLLDDPGIGGISGNDGPEGARGLGRWTDAAQSIERDGERVRLVRAVWSRGGSDPEDVHLRALAERGLRLPVRP